MSVRRQLGGSAVAKRARRRGHLEQHKPRLLFRTWAALVVAARLRLRPGRDRLRRVGLHRAARRRARVALRDHRARVEFHPRHPGQQRRGGAARERARQRAGHAAEERGTAQRASERVPQRSRALLRAALQQHGVPCA